MLNAVGYGFLTLVALWTGSGANPIGIDQRALVAVILYLVVAMAMTKINQPQSKPLGVSPKNWFRGPKGYLAATLGLAGSLGFFVALKSLAPSYFASQSMALTGLPLFSAGFLMLTLSVSGFCYHRFFSPAWGFKSGAFLEALTWGLAIQSFVAFVWIFSIGWVFSRLTDSDSAIGSATIRLLVGLAWIALL